LHGGPVSIIINISNPYSSIGAINGTSSISISISSIGHDSISNIGSSIDRICSSIRRHSE